MALLSGDAGSEASPPGTDDEAADTDRQTTAGLRRQADIGAATFLARRLLNLEQVRTLLRMLLAG